MMMWKDSGVPADSFYEARSESADGPKSKFKIKAGKTLSARRWHAAFSPDGHLDIASVLSRIQRGGVHPSIRGEVWEFLLGCFDPKSTIEEREQQRQHRRVQYARWKELCQALDSHVGSGRIITAPVITEDGQPIQDPLVLLEANPDQSKGQANGGPEAEPYLDKQVIEWKLTLHQIGLDVLRTDRTLVFYEKKENLSKLWDILAVYAWIDKDVGYCQETLGGGDYLFAVRMFMVLFRRELSFGDSLYLWEMMWALEYYPDMFCMYEEPELINEKNEVSKGKVKSIRQFGKFERENLKNGTKTSEAPLPITVFLVASVLKEKSARLIQEARGLDDVVKVRNYLFFFISISCLELMATSKRYPNYLSG
ncbi:TBC domain containing protein [Musa troglodytarum]|uniref:TBC domain containing protein n=1 Tax=Musa troglodytarum TaxID=320322 RepID=A0A9E7GXS3_9LILI|nr:TBC domain containing protein [Musa troglodytarum]